MKLDRHSRGFVDGARSRQGASSMGVVLGLGAVLLLALVLAYSSRRKAADPLPAAAGHEAVVAAPPHTVTPTPPATEAPPTGASAIENPVVAEPLPTPTPAAEPAPQAPPSEQSRSLVRSLVQPLPGTLTPETAEAWKASMAQIVGLGAGSVGAIREFLAKNEDIGWGEDGRRLLGYDSARAAMFDVLAQVGGPEAEGALLTTMTGTLEPREIAQLARYLETLAPGQHSEAAVEAARQSMAAAARGDIKDREMAPAFEVLKQYGGPGVAGELEQAASRWNYYSALALAQMPDGAGVPSLVRLADGSTAENRIASDPAIRMLGSLAGQNEQARTAFLEFVKQDRISPSTWAAMGPILAGDQVQFTDGVLTPGVPFNPGSDVRQTHLSFGNQNFLTRAPGVDVTPDYWSTQLKWLDQLGTSATSQAAQAAIQQAKQILETRTPKP